MEARHAMFILMAAFDCLVFRAELVSLFGVILLYELIQKRVSILS